jgi:hypothetical protein
MRRIMSLGFIAAIILNGCTYDGAQISQPFWLGVSRADIAAAVVAARAAPVHQASDILREVVVVSRDEIHLDWGAGQDVVKRKNGKWQFVIRLVMVG